MSGYSFEMRVFIDHTLLWKINDAIERMCDLLWDVIPEEADMSLGLIRDSNPPRCYAFETDMDYHHQENIIGLNAGYTYMQIYHTRTIIRLVIDDRKTRLATETNPILQSYEQSLIEDCEKTWDILNGIGLEWTGPVVDDRPISW